MQPYYQRSSVFKEFTAEEKKQWFSLKVKAVSHHIDTLYYTVSIFEDKSGKEKDLDFPLHNFLSDLEAFRSEKLLDRQRDIKFMDLSVIPTGAQVSGGLYGYHLQEFENYDIFISSYIPNDDTPRIQVQLRTRSLVLDGLYGAIEKSFRKVKEILREYGLAVGTVTENRIDYAFHSNLIQKPLEMFGTESLEKHLVTSFREIWEHIWITTRHSNHLDLDYFALGDRKSNRVYFRAYEKEKEVIQQNYKGFFFQLWRDRGLISAYDQYVFEKAYELGSYKTGLLIGRIDWYLENGHNEDLKEYLMNLRMSCNIKSDNNPAIEKAIDGVLPRTTVIMNCEFETKRGWYLLLDDWLSHVDPFLSPGSHFDDARDHADRMKLIRMDWKEQGRSIELKRLYTVLSVRRELITKLMSDIVEFTENRDDPDSPVMDWWKRLRRVKIKDQPDEEFIHAWYTYSRRLDAQRTKKRWLRTLGTYSAIQGQEEEEGLGSDLWAFLTNLNDNDLHHENMESVKEILTNVECPEYDLIKQRTLRQQRSLFQKIKEKKFKEKMKNEALFQFKGETSRKDHAAQPLEEPIRTVGASPATGMPDGEDPEHQASDEEASYS